MPRFEQFSWVSPLAWVIFWAAIAAATHSASAELGSEPFGE